MSDYNHVGLIGRVTRDAELKYTGSGTAVLNFSIAVNRSIPPKDGGEWRNEASFFDVQAWGKLAESKAQILVKGKQVIVGGELRQDRWEQDGQARSKVFVLAETIQGLAEARREGAERGAEPPRQARPHGAPAAAPSDDFTDDIPF